MYRKRKLQKVLSLALAFTTLIGSFTPIVGNAYMSDREWFEKYFSVSDLYTPQGAYKEYSDKIKEPADLDRLARQENGYNLSFSEDNLWEQSIDVVSELGEGASRKNYTTKDGLLFMDGLGPRVDYYTANLVLRKTYVLIDSNNKVGDKNDNRNKTYLDIGGRRNKKQHIIIFHVDADSGELIEEPEFIDIKQYIKITPGYWSGHKRPVWIPPKEEFTFKPRFSVLEKYKNNKKLTEKEIIEMADSDPNATHYIYDKEDIWEQEINENRIYRIAYKDQLKYKRPKGDIKRNTQSLVYDDYMDMNFSTALFQIKDHGNYSDINWINWGNIERNKEELWGRMMRYKNNYILGLGKNKKTGDYEYFKQYIDFEWFLENQVQDTKYKVVYKEKNTNNIIDSQTFTGKVREEVTIVPKKIAGYVYSPNPDASEEKKKLNITLTVNNPETILEYEKTDENIIYRVLLKELKEDGSTEIIEGTMQEILAKPGDHITIRVPDISEEYILIGKPEHKLIAREKDLGKTITIEFLFRKRKEDLDLVTNYYDDRDGKLILFKTKTTKHDEGSYVKADPETFEGYEFIKADQDPVVIKSNKKNVLNLYYKNIKEDAITNIVIKDEEGNVIHKEQIKGKKDDNVWYNYPTIDGYSPKDNTEKGTTLVLGKDTEVTVIYKEDKTNINRPITKNKDYTIKQVKKDFSLINEMKKTAKTNSLIEVEPIYMSNYRYLDQDINSLVLKDDADKEYTVHMKYEDYKGKTPVIVEHKKDNGKLIKKDVIYVDTDKETTLPLEDLIGQSIDKDAIKDSKLPYEVNKDNSITVTASETNNASDDNVVTIKYKEDLKDLEEGQVYYFIEYYNGTELLDKDIRIGSVGDKITPSPKDFEDMKFIKAEPTSLTLSEKKEDNVFKLYYETDKNALIRVLYEYEGKVVKTENHLAGVGEKVVIKPSIDLPYVLLDENTKILTITPNDKKINLVYDLALHENYRPYNVIAKDLKTGKALEKTQFYGRIGEKYSYRPFKIPNYNVIKDEKLSITIKDSQDNNLVFYYLEEDSDLNDFKDEDGNILDGNGDIIIDSDGNVVIDYDKDNVNDPNNPNNPDHPNYTPDFDISDTDNPNEGEDTDKPNKPTDPNEGEDGGNDTDKPTNPNNPDKPNTGGNGEDTDNPDEDNEDGTNKPNKPTDPNEGEGSDNDTDKPTDPNNPDKPNTGGDGEDNDTNKPNKPTDPNNPNDANKPNEDNDKPSRPSKPSRPNVNKDEVVYYIVYKDGNKVIEEDREVGKHNQRITVKPKKIKGYKANSNVSQSIVLNKYEKINEIVFYYTRDKNYDKDNSYSSGGDRGLTYVVSLPNKYINKKDHMAYVQGYEDGTIKPNGNITRAEVAVIINNVLNDKYKEEVKVKQNKTFKDIEQSDWYYEPIMLLAKANIINGYEDSTFKPNQPITRAETTKILSSFEKLSPKYYDYKDIEGHWAKDYINNALAKNWAVGYEDGSFRPDQPITRAEFIKMTNRLLARGPKNIGNLLKDRKTFKDVDINTWYYLDIMEATHNHDYQYDMYGGEKWTNFK